MLECVKIWGPLWGYEYILHVKKTSIMGTKGRMLWTEWFLKRICWSPNLKYNAIWRWALWGVIELSCLEHGALGWDPCPCKKKLQLSLSLSAPWRHKEERAICRPGRGLSLRSKSTDTLKLDFSGSRTEKNRCLSLWYFVIAAQADWYCRELKIYF